MLDPKTLLPEVKRLVPNFSDQELMAGIQEFQQAHPNFTNDQALQALTQALEHQGGGQPASDPDAKPFEGLIGKLGAN